MLMDFERPWASVSNGDQLILNDFIEEFDFQFSRTFTDVHRRSASSIREHSESFDFHWFLITFRWFHGVWERAHDAYGGWASMSVREYLKSLVFQRFSLEFIERRSGFSIHGYWKWIGSQWCLIRSYWTSIDFQCSRTFTSVDHYKSVWKAIDLQWRSLIFRILQFSGGGGGGGWDRAAGLAHELQFPHCLHLCNNKHVFVFNRICKHLVLINFSHRWFWRNMQNNTPHNPNISKAGGRRGRGEWIPSPLNAKHALKDEPIFLTSKDQGPRTKDQRRTNLRPQTKDQRPQTGGEFITIRRAGTHDNLRENRPPPLPHKCPVNAACCRTIFVEQVLF